MASFNSANVTIGKDYFEVLLRKAQANDNGIPLNGPANRLTVCIPKADHDKLLDTARQLGNLRRNLLGGGVTEETLFILCSDETQADGDAAAASPQGHGRRFGASLENTNGKAQEYPQNYMTSANGGQDYNFNGIGHGNGHHGQHHGLQKQYNNFQDHQHDFDDMLYEPDGPIYADGNGNGNSNGNVIGNFFVEQPRLQPHRPQYKRDAKRTVVLANLAEGITHADVVAHIRGGMLLDVYIRNDRTCAVSFVDEDDAQAFFNYAKRNDLYIRDKRVEMRWGERHFILPGHVANKISIGATRNLIIRNANPSHTEASIRSHAEHIHNLVIVSVEAKGQNVLVECNSIHNAMFLKTCLMSRATYKGSKIDWDVDECASPIPMPVRISRKENVPAKKAAPMLNRFQLLNLDGTEDGSEDENENNTSDAPTISMDDVS